MRRFASELNAAMVDVVENSSPAVVSIVTTKFDFDPGHPSGSILPSGPQNGPTGAAEDPGSNPMRKTGIGSGTLVNLLGDIYVLTNFHVVHGVDRILVQLQDEREFEASVKGWDSKVDIAVLEVPGAEDLPSVAIGSSEKLRVGELVLAMGSPFGLPHTVTIGIVSAVGRYAQGIEEYEDFIQTDAAINRGNSGGPLLNLKGQVVGLNTAIRTTHMGGNVGIGFAIPMHMIVPVAEQLLSEGVVARGWLGTSVQNITPGLARAFLMPNATGVVVTAITPGGPAERGGLSRGDIILQVDNSKIANANKLRNLIAATRPGSTVKMAVVRGRRTMALLVTVGQGPFAKDEFRPPSKKERWTGLGLTIQDVTADIAAAIGLSEPGGALITDVAAGSPAGRARPVPLTRGDVILEMQRIPVRGAQHLRAMLKTSKPDARVLLFIYRKGSTLFTVVTMPGSSQAVSDPK
ncbi:MAG: trypsin-like peptidase domain-containing protein [Planctomycetes bacterium]|nr:trypsin-like peptidase domain-containing protein [Planctomycetota bacterium]